MYHSSSPYNDLAMLGQPLLTDTVNLCAPASPSNYYFMHWSSSTHPFLHHYQSCRVPDPTPGDLLDFSASDLQVKGGERVGRYTAEEKMKRIERYRSKRNHRNFHKKITYACRKTLADSRPRVRGRFTRNEETEPEADEIPYESYINDNKESFTSYNKYENEGNAGEWWRKVPNMEEGNYDENVWASFDSVFSMNLLS